MRSLQSTRTTDLTTFDGTNSEQSSEGNQLDITESYIFDAYRFYKFASEHNPRLDFAENYRYNDFQYIAQGGFGQVVSAWDLKGKQRVAIKQIQNLKWHRSRALGTLREISILCSLSHENIISINGVLGHNGFNEVYIIQPLIFEDLHTKLRRSGFSMGVVGLIIHQIFRALKYLHAASIIHRDLKPSNILVAAEDNKIKICDFNMARIYGDDEKDDEDCCLTEDVSTRYYRAPEVIVSEGKYDKSIDVWAVGCILAEFFVPVGYKRILFPGSNDWQMLELIVKLLGNPVEEDLANVANPVTLKFIKKLEKSKRADWFQKFPESSDDACDLLDKILTMNPKKRISVEEALNHPYLNYFREVPDYKFEKPLFSEKSYKKMKQDEIIHLIAEKAADM